MLEPYDKMVELLLIWITIFGLLLYVVRLKPCFTHPVLQGPPYVFFLPPHRLGFNKVRGDDFRVNKTPGLFVLTELLGKEHNAQVDKLRAAQPSWSEDIVFEEARRRTIAVWQKIVTREWLATSVGEPLPPYEGYNSNVNPNIDMFWTTVAMRYGHSEVNAVVPRVDETGEVSKEFGHGLLRDLYFKTPEINQQGAALYFRGMATFPQGVADLRFQDDVYGV